MTPRRVLLGTLAARRVRRCVRRDGLGAGPASRRRSTRRVSRRPSRSSRIPLDRNVQFVVEQAGRIRVVRSGTRPADRLSRSAHGVYSSGGERGLLGLAFAPDAPSGRFYVNFTNRSGDTVVARFRRSARSARRRPGVAIRSALRRPERTGRDRAAVLESQRRTSGLRAGRLPVHRPRRRRLR